VPLAVSPSKSRKMAAGAPGRLLRIGRPLAVVASCGPDAPPSSASSVATAFAVS
jgi:hypothetical protein